MQEGFALVYAFALVASCRIGAEAIIHDGRRNESIKQGVKKRKLFSESIYATRGKSHSPFPSIPMAFNKTQPMKIYT